MNTKTPIAIYAIAAVPSLWIVMGIYSFVRILTSSHPAYRQLATTEYFVGPTVLMLITAAALYLLFKQHLAARWLFLILLMYQIYILGSELLRDPIEPLALIIPPILIASYTAASVYLWQRARRPRSAEE